MDAHGCVYVCGVTQNTNTGNGEITVVKYSQDGELKWSSAFPNPGADLDNARPKLKIGSGCSVFVGFNYAPFTGATNTDIYVVKFDSTGNQQWVATYNGPGNDKDSFTGLAFDNQGNTYVSGSSYVDGINGEDFLVVKFNNAGVEQWAALHNGLGNGNDAANSVAVDNSGNVYATGFTYNASGNTDYTTIRYNSNGSEAWAVNFDGQDNLNDYAAALKVDINGNIAVTGSSQTNADAYDFATVKYNSSGVQQWVKYFTYSLGKDEIAVALATDNNGNIFVTGNSGDQTQQTTNPALSFADTIITIKYSSAGTQEWAVPEYFINTNPNIFVFATASTVTGLVLDALGNAYITGYRLDNTFNFQNNQQSFGYSFITVKYDQQGTAEWKRGFTGTLINNQQINFHVGVSFGLSVPKEDTVYVAGGSANSGVFAITTVKFSPCIITADAGQDATIASGQSVQIGSAPVINLVYSWSPVDGLDDPNIANPIASPTTTTTSYVLTVRRQFSSQCLEKDTVTITISSPSSSCANAIDLGQGDTCATNFNVSGNEIWFRFISDSQDVDILAINLAGKINAIEIFSGTCSALNSIFLKNDTNAVVFVKQKNLVPNQLYYIKFTTSINNNINVCIQNTQLQCNHFELDFLPSTSNVTVDCSNPNPSFSVTYQLPDCVRPYLCIFCTSLNFIYSICDVNGNPVNITPSGNCTNTFYTFDYTNTPCPACDDPNCNPSTNPTACGYTWNFFTGCGGNEYPSTPVCNFTIPTSVSCLSPQNGPYYLCAKVTALGGPNGLQQCVQDYLFSAADPNGGPTQYCSMQWPTQNPPQTCMLKLVKININIPQLSVTTTTQPATCNDGSATANVTGGCGAPYTYSWNTTPVQNTQTANNLSAGSYQVTVTDGNGCTVSATAVVGGNSSIAVTVNKTNTSCSPASCTGSATLNVSGGVGPYSYAWTPAVAGNTNTANNLCVGTYQVIVTDNVGCTKTVNITIIKNPSAINVAFTFTPASCYSVCDGSATATASGGSPPYTFVWSTSPTQTGPTAVNLCGNNPYQVIVTDATGCTKTGNISQMPISITPPSASFTFTNERCMNQQFTFTANTIGGVFYQWDFGDGATFSTANTNIANHLYLNPGEYKITLKVSNSCGCSASAQIVKVTPTAGQFYNCNCCSFSKNYTYSSDFTVTPSNFSSFLASAVNNTISIRNKLKFTGNTTYTLTGLFLEFGPWGKMIIDRGTTVILNGTRLSGINCGGSGCFGNLPLMWQGVEVWGNYSQSQTIANQGKLITKSNGTVKSEIASAHNAILVGKFCDLPPSASCGKTATAACIGGIYDIFYGGGIIDIQSGTTFTNNARTILFTPYSPNNISKVDKSLFSCTALLDPGYHSNFAVSYHYGTTPANSYNPRYSPANALGRTNRFVYEWGVKGVKFTDNSFDNAEVGIQLNNSSAYIQKITTGNLFKNMNIGISAYYSSSTPFLANVIDGNTFDNTQPQTTPTGIYIQGGNGDVIRNNIFIPFNANAPASTSWLMQTGISMFGSTAFQIHDNRFFHVQNGIGITGSGTGGGVVGNWAKADQFTLSSLNGGGNICFRCSTSIGTFLNNSKLQLRCNTTINTFPNNEYSGQNWMNYILSSLGQQGAPSSNNATIPAGNRFDYNMLLNKQIKAATNNSYLYYGHSGPSEYVPTRINVGGNNNSTSCPTPSTCCPKDPCAPPSNLGCRLAQIGSYNQQLTQLQILFNTTFANLDKGQTAQLLAAIGGNTSDGNLKNMLLDNSFLSDEVLLAFIGRQSTAPGIFKEVMIPNSPVSDAVLPSLKTKMQSLPPGIASQVEAAQSSFDYNTLTSISRQIAYTDNQRQIAINDLLSTYVQSDSIQSVINFLNQEQSLYADQSLVATYIVDSTYYTDAQQKLASMSASNPDEQAFIDLQTMILNLNQQGKTFFEMDSMELQLVQTIANMNSSLAQANACAILNLISGYECPVQIPSVQREQLIISENVENKFSDVLLGENIPNPFNNTSVIPYYLPETIDKAFINIYDISGQKIKSYEVTSKKNILILSADDFSNGMYFYKLENNTATFGSKKMVITK